MPENANCYLLSEDSSLRFVTLGEEQQPYNPHDKHHLEYDVIARRLKEKQISVCPLSTSFVC